MVHIYSPSTLDLHLARALLLHHPVAEGRGQERASVGKTDRDRTHCLWLFYDIH
jgi:hypothetical protein